MKCNDTNLKMVVFKIIFKTKINLEIEQGQERIFVWSTVLTCGKENNRFCSLEGGTINSVWTGYLDRV